MGIQYILELLGTFFFAMSGALAMSERDEEQDWFGATFTGFVTAIGGGSLRDMLLGSYPLVWIGNILFLYTILIGIVCSGLFYNWLAKLRRTFLLFDTLGIALFTIVGTEKALSMGVRPEIAAIMGMFTAVMGGVLRDILTNEMPVLFKKEIYSSACLFGAALYLVMYRLDVERNTSFLVAVVFIIIIRLLAVKYKLTLPKFRK
ncbi:putative membrane protein YeiH [Pontibacter aydingkolensis]|uniref:Trimeric intracellular cation channel family protein n=1 Tax=Pontibacter aydingkolensis TaxID=1911536 RepID=A0ABS7CU42_9BACT|nr:trimeric intracellular cation channel family protein [Pontibacter aydingkolensis]MBW7467315.1 trimeric intracellular cation channel family protein [Pontibacter aydingkolensis]